MRLERGSVSDSDRGARCPGSRAARQMSWWLDLWDLGVGRGWREVRDGSIRRLVERR